jgi:sulfur carrier protein
LKIAVNGETLETGARDLAALCVELGFGEAKIATARNGEFVAATARGQERLAEGDAVEIVAPRQGG